MSIDEAYRARKTGCIFGTEEVKAQLADIGVIAVYLGTKDPIELGAALLLEQSGYERSQLQLSLEVAGKPSRHRRTDRRRAGTRPLRAVALSKAGQPHERREMTDG